ncbi:hypothetical protein ACHQM5_008203 [Ranunculus cassubicifolius]
MASTGLVSGFSGGFPSSKLLVYMAITGVGGLIDAKLNGLRHKIDSMSNEMIELHRIAKEVDKLHGVPDKLDLFTTKCEFGDVKDKLDVLWRRLENAVKDLKTSQEKDAENFRKFVHLISEEIKKDTEKADHIGKLTKYAMQVAAVVAVGGLGYTCLHRKGITISGMYNGTKRGIGNSISGMNNGTKLMYNIIKRSMANAIFGMYNGTKRRIANATWSVTKRLEQKSAALTEKMRNLTDRMESNGKVSEHGVKEETLNQIMNGEDQIETSKSSFDQEYSDNLFKLVMEEGQELDEEFLGEVFDVLNENHIAARGFISKPSHLRKKWLMTCATNKCLQ